MTEEEAELIFDHIRSSKNQNLVEKLIKTGIRYARIRVDYALLTIKEKKDLEEERTIAHNAFISTCDILARNMANQGEDNSWRNLIGRDRKEIGDFACWMHLVLGLRAS